MAISTFKDLIKSTTTTTGTGTLSLGSAFSALYRPFADLGDGATTYYRIDDGASNVEIGEGVWNSAGNTLTRARVLYSTNSNALVSFAAGTKTVGQVFPEEVMTSISNFTAGSIPFGGASGRLTQDNAKLFWDATGKQLMVGTNNPTQNPSGDMAIGGNLVAYRTQSVDTFNY